MKNDTRTRRGLLILSFIATLLGVPHILLCVN